MVDLRRRALACVAFTLIAKRALGEGVESLTATSFDSKVSSDFVVVKFYAPWCGHCKAMAPAYEEAARRLSQLSPPIPLAKVDATQEPELSQRQGIRGYPTLKIFRKGVASDYSGPRDVDGIVSYVKKEAGIVGADAPVSQESQTLMSKLCQGQTCEDDTFPMIEYDESSGKCHCAQHPCWDDNGQTHACESAEHPHLRFSYTKDGALECGCSSTPHYLSKYIALVKCPGEHCDNPDFPILDFDTDANRCSCKKHPCNNLDGSRHLCSDPKFPLLHYREDKSPDGSVKAICECRAKIRHRKAHEEF